jgi:phosphoribosylglycinamide formyltransferase 1
MRERLAILISGGGSTMEQIIKACQSGEVPMDISCVIASTPIAGGIEKARRLGIENISIIEPGSDQTVFGSALLRVLSESGATIVNQNGWLPRTPKIVIDAYESRIFNQHPGPKKETRAMHGTQPHAVMLYIARLTGRNEGTDVIVHRVNEKWDDGPTVAIAHVPINSADYPKRLQTRALLAEHQLQITHLQNVANGTVPEITAAHAYIRPGEEAILQQARQQARRRFPHG